MSQLIKPPEKMTVTELRNRVAFHVGMAETFRSYNEFKMARSFIELANRYGDELERRGESASCLTAGTGPV